MSRTTVSRTIASRAVLVALLLATATGITAAGTAADWPALRGADGRGVSAERGLPVEWSGTENVAWKMAIPGRGHSSPIISGDRIFLTTAIRKEAVEGHDAVIHTMPDGSDFLHPDSVDAEYVHEYRVLAIDVESGEILWNSLAAEGLPYDDRHNASSYASPTPITDGERLYAYFGTPGVFAFDLEGSALWKVDLGPMATLGMGVGTSPLLFGDLLIIQADLEIGEDSFLVALDKHTGEERWRTSRAGIEVSWTTPVLVATEDRNELVTSGNQLLISYNPATGEELWRMDGLHSNSIHRPLVHGDTVILTAGYPTRILKAVRLGGSGDLTDSEYLRWTYNKGTAYVASSLAYDGQVYALADNGVVTALDADTGEIVYEGGRPPVPQRFYASPIAYDGKFLLVGEDGEIFVIRAGPEFEVLATNSMGEKLWATPAIANGRIYIRGSEHLYAIGGEGS
jgi:outer membrane protein assembly factor BamB